MKKTENGFVVTGNVKASNLNSDGVPIHERLWITADVKENSNSQYQLLPDGMYVRPPEGAETPYTPGSGPGGTMTEEERNGINIAKVSVKGFGLIRGFDEPVWKKYGGISDFGKVEALRL